jgi:ABC-type Na+ efflux pump permease subunit
MTILRLTGRDNLRVVGALASKDIVDVLKNRSTLGSILAVIFLVVFYWFLPAIEQGDLLPRAVVYAPGDSALVDQLENNPELDLVVAGSQDGMEGYVAGEDLVVLGLVIPPGFEAAPETAGPTVLDGYVAHWAGDEEVLETQAFFEEQLSDLTGRPIQIDLAGHTVRTRADSTGLAFRAALSLIVPIIMIGLTLTPQLMIEEKRTKTLDVLLVSPATAGHVTLGKAMTGLFYCLVSSVIILLIYGYLVAHWWLVILAMVCGSLLIVGLGLLLGTILEQQGQLRLWTFVMFQPLLLPIVFSIMSELLPAGLLKAMNWIPTVALFNLIRISFAEIADPAQYGPQLALLAGSAALLLATVAWLVGRSDR